MVSGRPGGLQRQLHGLFAAGTVAGVTEGGLLARFLTRGDEVAFEALVARHGPMVLGVCRRVLGDPCDVEDAFQATFLILVSKAGSLRDGNRLGPWLHGVASRVAVRARSRAARRRTIEGRGARETTVETAPAEASDWADVRPVFDEELARLPERYRAAVVLCCLEGLGPEEAASQLGCPVGTIKSRLARGRERLRARLTRRGLAPAAGLPWVALSAEAARAAMPAALAASTVETATRFAGGKMAAGTISAALVVLMKGGVRTMFLTRTYQLLTAILSVGVVATCVGVLAQQGEPAKPAQPPSGQAPTRGTVAPARQDADIQQSLRSLAESRVELARKAYDDVLESLKGAPSSQGLTGAQFMDRVTTWSGRWMEAECDVSSDRSHQIAAREAHWKRLKTWEEEFAPHVDKEVDRPAFNTLKFYRLEAEYELTKAKAER